MSDTATAERIEPVAREASATRRSRFLPAPTWFGLALASAAWLFASEFFGYTPPLLWLGLAIASVPSFVTVPVALPGPRTALIAAALALPAAVLGPWPAAFGPLLLALGLLASVLASRFARAVSRGFIVAGSVWLLLGVTMLTYESFTSVSPGLPMFLKQLLAGTLRLVGIHVTIDGDHLVMFSMRTKHPLSATWTLLIDPASACFSIGGLFLIVVAGVRRRWRSMLAFAGTMALWLPAKATLMCAIYLHRVLITEYDESMFLADQFWTHWIYALLLVPAAFLAWRFVAMSRPDTPSAPPTPLGRGQAVATVLAFVAACALMLSLLWHPSGERKPGRIMIDEYHCKVDKWTQWRWPQKRFDTTSTLRPYDQEWYGEAAAYNYATTYELSSRYYTMSRLVDKPVDDDVLRDVDVFVIKLPSKRFTKPEILAVHRFVARGGGLFLLGEHTAVFGSGVPLNRLARDYGFEFRYDCLFGIDSVFEQTFDPPPVPHPVIQHMGTLDFATSCSIKPLTWAGTTVIRDNALLSLHADFFSPNFYPATDVRPDMIPGAFVQLWARDVGRGRVLAFTDSTIFANFSIFERGKSQLWLGMMEWLDHEAGPSLWWLDALTVVLLLGALAVAFGTRTSPLLLLAAVVLGWVVGSALTRTLHAVEMPVPACTKPTVTVSFERSLNPRVELPRSGFIAGKDYSFGLFERSVQRMTKVHTDSDPGVTWTSFRANREAALAADLVVFIHPTEHVDDAFRDALVGYVKRGGKVLVLDSPANTGSSADELLSPWHAKLERSAKLEGELDSQVLPKTPIEESWAVDGGTPIATIHGKPVAARIDDGSGCVIVLGFGSRFSDAATGVTGSVVPDEKVRKVYDLGYALYGGIIDDRLR